MGPGLGQSPQARKLVTALVADPRPAVIDADGLNLLAGLSPPAAAVSATRVLTPHPGEYRRLAQPLGLEASPVDADARPLAATELAQAYDAVVALKGHATVVTDGRKLFTNETGNPAMSTAGSGDVLTGVVASLMAQGMGPFEAAVLGVHTHGLAGDLWAADHGPAGMLARELADRIPPAMQQLRR
jgi:NAD(P)H-hydrate epimerase